MVVGVILTVLGGLIAIGNWSAPFVARRTGGNVSIVPFVGGIFLSLGIYTVTKSARWALLGFLDLGTIGGVIFLPLLVHEFWSTSRFARMYRFICNDSGRDITVELFRRNRASISFASDQSVAPNHFDNCPVSIGLSGEWRPTDEGFEVFNYADGRRTILTQQGESFVASESSIPDSARSFTRLNGLRFLAPRDA